jgi:hypothetical protein
MWEVSVPSWDEPSGAGGGDSGKKGRRKSATSTTAVTAVTTGDVFKVVTASLQGEAVAQVQRAIEEAPSRRKRRKQSQMELEAPSPAPQQGTHTRDLISTNLIFRKSPDFEI